MKKVKVTYIHGFGGENSSKFTMLKEYFANDKNIIIEKPKQYLFPSITISAIKGNISTDTDYRHILIGSSRGGAYALYLGYLLDIPVITFNPAIIPSDTNKKIMSDGLEELDIIKIYDDLDTISKYIVDQNQDPHNEYLTNLFLATNDEIIDYREAEKLNSRYIHYEPDDHRFSKTFSQQLPRIKEIIKTYEIYNSEDDFGNYILEKK